MYHIIAIARYTDQSSLWPLLRLCRTFDNGNANCCRATANTITITLHFHTFSKMFQCVAQLEALEFVQNVNMYEDERPLTPPRREEPAVLEWPEDETSEDPASPVLVPSLPYCFEM
jgi:hypothetical protein